MLATYDITVAGVITIEAVDANAYETAVPFTGELIFDDVFDNQGRLLYNKAGSKFTLIGVRDGQLLLTVKIEQD